MILNELLSSACGKLAERFEGCMVYREKIPQGFERPAFFAEASLIRHRKTLPGRAWREYAFQVSFFPGKDGGPKAQEAADALPELFGSLCQDGRAVLCSPVRMKMAEGVLRAEFSVSVVARRIKDTQEGELMGRLSRLSVKR